MAGILPTLFDKDLTNTQKGFGMAGAALQGIGNFIQSNAYAQANRTKAKQVIRNAGWQESRMRLQKRQNRGTNVFAFARAGIRMEGTARDVQDFVDEQMETDIKQMWTNANEEAKALKKAAKASKLAGTLSLAGSLL
jgi:flagellar motor component MotA